MARHCVHCRRVRWRMKNRKRSWWHGIKGWIIERRHMRCIRMHSHLLKLLLVVGRWHVPWHVRIDPPCILRSPSMVTRPSILHCQKLLLSITFSIFPSSSSASTFPNRHSERTHLCLFCPVVHHSHDCFLQSRHGPILYR
jgi:hypothetical protein